MNTSIKVLVTGASGFVGGRIIKTLREKENMILYALIRDPAKKNHLGLNDNHVYIGDITKPETLKGPLAGKDVVIHCAGLMSNFDSEPKDRFYEINVTGSENVLRACDPSSIKRFLHISTAGVYGPTPDTPAGEGAPYGAILSDYEESKKEAEVVVLKYAKAKAIPFTILRPSQLYGSGMRYGWTDTIRSIKARKMLIPGSGKAKIHLLNVEDLVRAIELVLTNETAENKIYNISGPEIFNLREVFYIISDALGSKRPKRVSYLPVYMVSLFLNFMPRILKTTNLALLTPHRVRFFSTNHIYDISKAKNELNYMPKVHFKDGVREMIEWCRQTGLA